MLAPLRDCLSPEDPKLSPLLCTAKERYFARMSVDIDPNKSNFRETRWITSEDVNVEHLLDVFTKIDDSDVIWNSCINFMRHLHWHKKRPTALGPKIEEPADNHRWKPKCLFQLSELFSSVGNHAERKRLLTHTLILERGRGSGSGVARILWLLSDVNLLMGLPKEGIRLAKEALDIYRRLNDPVEQTQCPIVLARLLCGDKRFDAAERAMSRAMALIPGLGKPNQFLACRSHRVLGYIYRSKGKTREAIHHYGVALGIASSFNWHNQLFWIHLASIR